MANTTITPYMNLILPIPGLEPGTQYAIDIDTAFTQIDQHTHIPGQGLPIPVAALNINADVPINSYNLTSIRSSRYVNQASPLSLSTDLNCVYVSNGELFYNDTLGNQVQLTLGGAVDTSGSGNITGMGSTTASAVYTAINNTFSFYSNTNTPANLLIGPITVGLNSTNTNTRVTLQPSSSQSSPYTLTFPDSLPSAAALVSTDNAGIQQNIAPDNVTTQIVGSQLVALFPPGIILPYGGNSIPTGWFLCNGAAISRTTFSTLFAAIGLAYGSGDGSTTFNIPDCRGLFLRGVSGPTGNDPDSSTRFASNPGGNTGNNVGSLQEYATAVPATTSFIADSTGSSHHHFIETGTPGGAPSASRTILSDFTVVDFSNDATNIDGTHVHTSVSGGDSETRPLNIYVNYLIKT